MLRSVTSCLAVLFLVIVSPALAQAPPRGRLLVTVADQTGAIIPRATVAVTGQDDPMASEPPHTAATSSVGVAVLDGLTPGRYTVEAEFPGFERAVVRDVRVKTGDNRRSIVLQIQKREEALTVERDKQSAAVDPVGNAFSTVLTRDQIDALPDDPDEMDAALKAMAPPGATVRVDGFTGGKLPPKSQIRAIRMPRMDMMAAQNHGGLGGMMHIDVMTQPGQGPLRGSADFAMRDGAMNARNPLAATKGAEGLQRYGATFGGTIRPNRSSFSVVTQRTSQFDTTNLLAATAGGTRAEPVRQPGAGFVTSVRFDQAVGKDHLLRFNFQRNSLSRQDLGVGGFDLPERGYSSDTADNIFRVSENGALGRRGFIESRFQAHWFGNDNRSNIEAPTIRVLDAFTSGGAQQTGGNHALEFEAATDIDYVRGRHSMRAGTLVEGGRYRSTETSNYLGTYTFTDLDAFAAGTPSLYTRRLGDPTVGYSNLQVGLYAQDDYRIAKSVMLSYGLRYEAQTMVRDQNNFSPRLSVSWSPFKGGKTTFRAGCGWFSDWIGTAAYRQTLQLDGVRQRELNVVDPSYPDPGLAGTMPATNRYLFGPDLLLPNAMTMNAGVDQQLVGTLRLSATYTYRRGSNLLRGRNLNAPIAGVRPDPALANVVEVVNDAGSRSHSLNVGANMLLLKWHRTLFAANYTFTSSESNTSGPFSLPAAADAIALEWGPTAARHRFGAQFNTQILPPLGISLTARAQSGTPYNITLPVDANHDGVFTDRPAGVGRNSGITAGQWDLGARLSYAIGFGRTAQAGGGQQVMVQIGGPGGGMPSGGISTSGDNNKRFRLEFYAAAQNITNHANYLGYSGVIGSPFFGKPTSVLNPRKLEVGMRFGF